MLDSTISLCRKIHLIENVIEDTLVGYDMVVIDVVVIDVVVIDTTDDHIHFSMYHRPSIINLERHSFEGVAHLCSIAYP